MTITLPADAPRLTYIPSAIRGESVIKVNDAHYNLPIHPSTRPSRKKNTPRHIATEGLSKALKHRLIHPGLGDIIHVRTPAGKHMCTILYCHQGSEQAELRGIWESYKKNYASLWETFRQLPKAAFRVDDLAGGQCAPYGYGGMTLSAKWWSHWRPEGKGGPCFNVPFLRKSIGEQGGTEMVKEIAPLIGQMGTALARVCPEWYEANKALGAGNLDCTFPPPEQQGGPRPIYMHQFCLRQFGGDLHGQSRGEALIALHRDVTDAGVEMPLMFMPGNTVGGDRCQTQSPVASHHGALGGEVTGSDLLVCDGSTGGFSARYKTSVKNTITIALFDSKNQLHGSVCSGAPEETGNLSLRLIPYLRGPIQSFVSYRTSHSEVRPPVVIQRARKLKIISRRDYEVGLMVMTQWGKQKKMYEAKIMKIVDQGQAVDLLWVRSGKRSLNHSYPLFEMKPDGIQ